jgi:hypothetical protein
MVPYDVKLPNPIDVRTIMDVEQKVSEAYSQTDYDFWQSSSYYYNALWGWTDDTADMNTDESTLVGSNKDKLVNTITYQGAQYNWKNFGNGNGDYTDTTLNTGHWGPNVYNGCGQVRRGQGDKFFKNLESKMVM